MKSAHSQRAKRPKNKPSSGAVATAQQHRYGVAADPKQCGRSRVTNSAARGSIVWLDHVDKRGPVARRFKDLVALVTSDLGGPDRLSEVQRQIVKRIASMSVWCESAEARMADGDQINIIEFGRTSNSLRRLCESVGLDRRSKDVTPSLSEYTASKRFDAEDALEEAS